MNANPIAASVDRIAGLMADLADERAEMRRLIDLEQGLHSRRGLQIEITADLSPEEVALMEMMDIVERNAR